MPTVVVKMGGRPFTVDLGHLLQQDVKSGDKFRVRRRFDDKRGNGSRQSGARLSSPSSALRSNPLSTFRSKGIEMSARSKDVMAGVAAMPRISARFRQNKMPSGAEQYGKLAHETDTEARTPHTEWPKGDQSFFTEAGLDLARAVSVAEASEVSGVPDYS